MLEGRVRQHALDKNGNHLQETCGEPSHSGRLEGSALFADILERLGLARGRLYHDPRMPPRSASLLQQGARGRSSSSSDTELRGEPSLCTNPIKAGDDSAQLLDAPRWCPYSSSSQGPLTRVAVDVLRVAKERLSR